MPRGGRLPAWPAGARAIPNHIARSSLFAPVGVGPRQVRANVQISSRGDAVICFWGEQLDMADCDVFLQILHLTSGHPLGTAIPIVRHQLLKAVGKDCAGAWYNWLHDSIRRLLIATITIRTKRYEIRGSGAAAGMHLIQSFEYDPRSETYSVSVDPSIRYLFENQEFALIDWERRFALKRRIDLAKWLQNYAASHQRGARHAISLLLLRDWCAYKSAPNKFRAALREALDELERVGILARTEISTTGLVSWVRFE